MKSRPILFSAPMVRALLDGSKTQTRRIVKPQPMATARQATLAERVRYPNADTTIYEWKGECPYGQAGDQLWVRETFYYETGGPTWYRADDRCLSLSRRWRPSIHMPRWASRITLEITDVRVQRLQEISEEDALAEGVKLTQRIFPDRVLAMDPVTSYRWLWEDINGAGSWDINPWVWALTFKRVTS